MSSEATPGTPSEAGSTAATPGTVGQLKISKVTSRATSATELGVQSACPHCLVAADDGMYSLISDYSIPDPLDFTIIHYGLGIMMALVSTEKPIITTTGAASDSSEDPPSPISSENLLRRPSFKLAQHTTYTH